ncbi:unnamed protein product [Phytophthora fragariaefolia]|uniref:Unnamed protein product n=1 Tax=Phytophthora fragariaefolia TaxID=1490495 RepID=A0A9W6UCS9_9STRA|nr:unnamed protein product [Phytophthora fragariaefolia]
MERLRSWPDHEFLHMKRDWNQSADKLASAALQRGDGEVVTSEEDKLGLIALNRLDELLMPNTADSIAHVAAVTRSARHRRVSPEVLQEEIVQRTRCERILQAQNEERWIVDLKAYLKGEVGNLSSDQAKNCAKLADDYEVDELDLLFYCPTTAQTDEDRDRVARLVVPGTLQQDFLHHYHTSLEGGNQGIGRTYHRIRAHFHWRGLYRSVQRYVGECIDCETGKGRPVAQVTRQFASHVPVPDDRDGSHPVVAEVVQGEHRALELGRSLLGICDREGQLFQDSPDGRGEL